MSTEVRFDADNSEDLAVLDAYCQASGKSRKDVMNHLLGVFVSEQVHVGTLVLRAKRINPLIQESKRTDDGALP